MQVQGSGVWPFFVGDGAGPAAYCGSVLTVVLQPRPEAAVASLVAFVESQAALQASRSLLGSPPPGIALWVELGV